MSRRLHARPSLAACVLSVLLCGALLACEESRTGVPERSTPEPVARPAYDPGELAGTSWSLQRLGGRRLVEDSRITLRFEREAIAGYTGCNAFRGGQLQTAGGAFLTPGPEISLVPCTGDLGEQQGRFLTALHEAATYRRTASRLEIRDTVGQTTLLFDRSDD